MLTAYYTVAVCCVSKYNHRVGVISLEIVLNI